MIDLVAIRELDVIGFDGRPTFVSAASGLVCTGDYFHVVADDSLHLASFLVGDPRPGQLTRILEGELPVSATERKQRKPDLEALVTLPRFGVYQSEVLLALGSGSRPGRRRGVLIALGPNGEPAATSTVDLGPLFDSFESRFAEINIEGAVVRDCELLLFQRGNAGSPINAIVAFPLERFLSALQKKATVPEPSIQQVELGRLGDVPLSFTDAAVVGDAIVFSAVAEETANAYDDGALVGAVVGRVTRDGRVHHCEALRPLAKVEGIEATVSDVGISLALVTDPDDPERPAGLFSATLPR
jgi:hypothetical protein